MKVRHWLLVFAALALLVASGATAAETKKTEQDKAPAKKEKSDAKPVIPVLSLDGPIVEAPQAEDSLFGRSGTQSLKDVLARIKKAREDKNVKAVVILLDDFASEMGESPWFNLAQMEELRQAIDQFQASGKEVYANVETCSTRTYALLSGVKQLSVVPTGIVWINGFFVESPYLRGLLEKIGVTPDFLACGEYKTAAEVFMRKEPSPAAQKMKTWLLDSSFEIYVDLVAKGRKQPAEKVRQWIDGGLYTAQKAQEAGIIDKVQHRQDFEAELKAKFGDVKFDRDYGKSKRGTEIDLSSPLGVFQFWSEMIQGPKKRTAGKSAIAIVYVDGPIMQGKADPSPFSSSTVAYSTPIRKALDKVAEDASVKAVVLRVDSPGGSAVASEIILNATKRVKAKKPFVVSMGNIAGSGGYYVACGSDTIFAEPSTITGSIGVVGGKIVTTGLWQKLGIHWDAQQRGANAGMLTSHSVFTEPERKRFQQFMDETYGIFKGHVVAARGTRLKKPIDEMAGGRVYTGKQALELGLVDKLGGLSDAVEYLAKKANVKDYELRAVPEPKGFLELLFEEMSDGKSDKNGLDASTRSLGRMPTSMVEMGMPYLQGLDGRRVQSVLAALRRLDLHQKEQILLMTPEISLAP
jgi:protease-4